MEFESKVNTYKCPKCKAVWRVKMERDEIDDENLSMIMGMSFDMDEAYCPRECRNVLGFKVKGKLQSE